MSAAMWRDDLAAWKRFLTAEGQVLSTYPHLLFQQAHNQPDGTAVARIAEARRASQGAGRPWLRWRNKPAAGDPCLLNLTGHANTVACVIFSPDGQYVVSAGWEDIIRVWDADTGQPIAELFDEEARRRREEHGSTMGVRACAYSPDGGTIASVHDGGVVRLWSTEAWTQTKSVEAIGANGIAWLPGGDTLVIGSNNLELTILDREGEYVGVFSVPSALWSPRRSRMSATCALSSDGTHLFAAWAEKGIGVWNVESRALEGRLEAARVSAWTASPDGSWIAMGDEKGTMAIWNVATRERMHAFDAHAREIDACAVSPDGSRMVTGSMKELKLWDTKTWAQLGHLAGHSLFLQSCAWSPRGDRIAAGAGLFSGGELRVWAASPADWAASRPRHSSVVGVATFSPDGRHVVSGTGWSNESGDRRTQTELQVWNVGEGRLQSTLPVVAGPDVAACVFPRGRREFVTTSGSYGGKQQTVDVWPIEGAAPRFTREGSAIAASPDGRFVVGGAPLEIWDLDAGSRVCVLEGISGARFCAFTPDSGALVAITAGGKSIRWEWSGGAARATAESPAPAPDLPEMACGAMSPDGSLLARGWRGGALDLVDARSLETIAALAAADPSVLYGMHTCAFSPDGRLLASAVSGAREQGSGDLGTVSVWSVADRRIRWRAARPAVISVCTWSADGRLLIVGSADGLVRLMSADDGREPGRFVTRTVISALSASPVESVLAAGDRDGYLHLLSFETREA